jgi:hypothetical protein
MADIDVSNAKPIPEAEYLRMTELLMANYGHIGPAFVARLIQSESSPEAIRAEIDAKAIAVAGKDASPLLWRSAGVFAILWQAGEMLAAVGLLPAVGDTVETKIKGIWQAYGESEEAKPLSPEQSAIDKLRETLYARRKHDVHSLRPTKDPESGYVEKSGYGEAVAWYEKDDKATVFYVRTDKLTALVGGAVKKNPLCKALKKEGILIPRSDTDRTYPRLPTGEQMQHYQLKFVEEAGDYKAFG